MTDAADQKLLHCPALSATKVISGKWKTRVLWLLRDRAFHFGELRRTLPGVSAKVLAAQMQELEAAGLISRQEEERDGVTFALYDYTDYGRSLIPVLDALGDWGLQHDARAATEN
ncbi:helix-turn-helix domain-containing protein [uncultured Litoreibacter sp.]|uniref:winged helix-turn-helix transcriptional regulator n=1 Tax=uncultured Litoreibacter sp. TaxID=1392394 RepID=UPI00262E0C09|nr:helix-turn-helix domain-containing protein [uncultured Litoreibacter sp.]